MGVNEGTIGVIVTSALVLAGVFTAWFARRKTQPPEGSPSREEDPALVKPPPTPPVEPVEPPVPPTEPAPPLAEPPVPPVESAPTPEPDPPAAPEPDPPTGPPIDPPRDADPLPPTAQRFAQFHVASGDRGEDAVLLVRPDNPPP